MDHLLPERLRLDGHVVQRAGHAVDDGGVGAGDVDHDGRRGLRPVVELHAADASAFGPNLDHLAPEQELRALRLRGALQVVGRELRVGDVAGGRPEHASCKLAAARLPEPLVAHEARRPVAARVVDGKLLADLRGIPLLERDAQLPGQADVLRQVAVVLGLHHQAPALDELREAALVVRLEVLRPAVPVVVALPRERDAVEGRVVHPDDGARGGGRPVAGGGEPVHVQGPVTELGEFEGGGGADDAGADDDGVVVMVGGRHHRVSRGRRRGIGVRTKRSRPACVAVRRGPAASSGLAASSGFAASTWFTASSGLAAGCIRRMIPPLSATAPLAATFASSFPGAFELRLRSRRGSGGGGSAPWNPTRAPRRDVGCRLWPARPAVWNGPGSVPPVTGVAAHPHRAIASAASPRCPARRRSRNRVRAPVSARVARVSSTCGRWA